MTNKEAAEVIRKEYLCVDNLKLIEVVNMNSENKSLCDGINSAIDIIQLYVKPYNNYSLDWRWVREDEV